METLMPERGPLSAKEDYDRGVAEARRDETERCARLCEALAIVHETSAARTRRERTFTSRAIWPPGKLVTFVMPGAERDARALEAAADGHRTVARCIRLGYDARKLEPDPSEKITRMPGACYCDLDEADCRAAGHPVSEQLKAKRC
jgi:hypothetical protein